MKCEKAKRMWMLSTDERLPWWRSIRLVRHMSSCPACREFASGYARTTDSLSRLPAPSPRPALAAALHLEAVSKLDTARSESRAARRKTWAGRLTFGGAGAGIAAFALMILLPGAKGVETTLEQDMVRAETGMAGLYEPVSASSPKGAAAIEDQIRSIEGEMKCLDAELETLEWNSLKGGSECNES